MKLETTVAVASLDGLRPIAESGEFAVFALANDTYTLVHRHAAVEWQALTISGDGLFRVAELLTKASRVLYRDVAARSK